MRNSINTVTKRLGVVLLVVGALMLVIGLYQISSDSWKLAVFFERWADTMLLNRRRLQQYPLAFYGSYLVIVGALLSVLYDRTTGKLVRWVISGKA
jgi:sulfite exporter TauE/SafE